MEKELMEIKEGIRNLYDIILDLSAGLWEMNTKVDAMLMSELGISPSESIEMSHTELPQSDTEPPVAKVRGRPRKEVEPQGSPTTIDVTTEVKIPQPEPQTPPKAPETPQKQSVMERLLGKDASDKQKQRAERMAQLEKELAELGQKK
jgi:hypothetical protein